MGPFCTHLNSVQLLYSPWIAREYTSDVTRAPSDFVLTFSLATDIDAGGVSHLLFVARPENKEVPEGRTVTMATIATNHIGRFIIEAAAAADARRQVEFYLLMSKHPRFKSPAGYMLFYAWFHGL